MTKKLQARGMTRLTDRQRLVLDDLVAGNVLYWPTHNIKGLRGIWVGPPVLDETMIAVGNIDVHARTAQALLHLKLISLKTRGHRVNRYTITEAGKAAVE